MPADTIDKCLQRLGLSQNPFSMAPDIMNFYSSERVETILVEVLELIDTRMGFALLYGDVGLGKTTICRRILYELDHRGVETSLVFNTSLQGVELLREINRDFGITAEDLTLFGQMSALNAFLLEQRSQGRNCVIIIDDAQGLSVDSLELVRQISNMETGVDKIVQIILIGQPELEEKLNLHSLRQLKSRIVLKRAFRPYTLAETSTYIRTKIARSGERVRLEVDDDAVRCVHQASGGIPRRINVIMGRCLYAAVAENTHLVDRKVAETAIRDVEESLDEVDPARSGRRRGWIAAAAGLVVAVPLAALLITYYGMVPASLSTWPPFQRFQSAVLAYRATPDDGMIAGQPPDTASDPLPSNPEAATATEPGIETGSHTASTGMSDVESPVMKVPSARESESHAVNQPETGQPVMGDTGGSDVSDVPDDNQAPVAANKSVAAPTPEALYAMHAADVEAPAASPTQVLESPFGMETLESSEITDALHGTADDVAMREPATNDEVPIGNSNEDVAAVGSEPESVPGETENSSVPTEFVSTVNPVPAPDVIQASQVDEAVWGFLGVYGLTEFAKQFDAAVRSYHFGTVSEEILESTGLRLVVLPAIVSDVAERYSTLQIPAPESDSTSYLLFWEPEDWPEENFSVFYGSSAVKRLQTALSRFGAYHYFIDGLAGRRTIAALKLFQRAVGLPETGTPDVATLFMLEYLSPHQRSVTTPVGVDTNIDRGWTQMEQDFSN